ncbi:MAG: hypothetical protein DRZ82_01850 [Thermoprotei archaeon]|nr:MAG: hypothetical protein DRZ82_01850 [Thermoprotei archaeon]
MIVERIINVWKEELQNMLNVIEHEAYVVRIGSSDIQFNDALYNTLGKPRDPANAISWSKGSAWNVRYDLKHWTLYAWRDVLCSPLYAHPDHDHAGDMDWGYSSYYDNSATYSTHSQYLEIKISVVPTTVKVGEVFTLTGRVKNIYNRTLTVYITLYTPSESIRPKVVSMRPRWGEMVVIEPMSEIEVHAELVF